MRRLALIAAMLMATPAVAAQWNVDPLTSKLLFTAEQAGEKFSGSFPAFTSVIAFDEAAPEKGSIRITIDMSKLQVEGKDRLDALPTDECWQHPYGGGSRLLYAQEGECGYHGPG
jgi:polyisoprenoid-binding protein YceI